MTLNLFSVVDLQRNKLSWKEYTCDKSILGVGGGGKIRTTWLVSTNCFDTLTKRSWQALLAETASETEERKYMQQSRTRNRAQDIFKRYPHSQHTYWQTQFHFRKAKTLHKQIKCTRYQTNHLLNVCGKVGCQPCLKQLLFKYHSVHDSDSKLRKGRLAVYT